MDGNFLTFLKLNALNRLLVRLWLFRDYVGFDFISQHDTFRNAVGKSFDGL